MTKGRILIVDDEPKLVRLLQEVFSATGYETLAAYNGEYAIETIALEQPDLVILDIMLGGTLDGYSVLQRIRDFTELPVILLTAKVRDADKLHGFDLGADDYLTKPFNSKELVARVRAVLKRAKAAHPSDQETEIICGPLQIDLARRRVMMNNREVHLTPTEYNLLVELARHANQVLLHEQLLTAVWGEQYRGDSEYLRAYIYTLRKKIEDNPTNPTLILRCPGIGYMLSVPSEQTA